MVLHYTLKKRWSPGVTGPVPAQGYLPRVLVGLTGTKLLSEGDIIIVITLGHLGVVVGPPGPGLPDGAPFQHWTRTLGDAERGGASWAQVVAKKVSLCPLPDLHCVFFYGGLEIRRVSSGINSNP